jgi:hypothetical protein
VSHNIVPGGGAVLGIDRVGRLAGAADHQRGVTVALCLAVGAELVRNLLCVVLQEVENGVVLIGNAIDLDHEAVEPGCAFADQERAEVDVAGLGGDGKLEIEFFPVSGALGATDLHVVKGEGPALGGAVGHHRPA